MNRSRAGIRYIIPLLVILPLALMLLLLALPGPKHQPLPLPKPNGYDHFISAGRSVTGALQDDSTTNQTDLRLFLLGNADALAKIRIGLGRECRVPLDTSPSAATNTTRMVDLGDLKSCARLLAAEGRLAILEAKYTQAVNSSMDLLRLGCVVTHGGVVIDAQVGLAIQMKAISQLDGLVGHLDPEQAGVLTRELPTIISSADTADAILEQEKMWARQVFGWRANFLRMLRPGLSRAVEQALKAQFSTRDTAVARLLEKASARTKPRQ